MSTCALGERQRLKVKLCFVSRYSGTNSKHVLTVLKSKDGYQTLQKGYLHTNMWGIRAISALVLVPG